MSVNAVVERQCVSRINIVLDDDDIKRGAEVGLNVIDGASYVLVKAGQKDATPSQ